MSGRGVRRLSGKLALITGGGGGLGFATARALAREGMRIALWDLDGTRAAAAAGQLRAEGADARGWAVDVSDPAAVRAAAAALEKEMGPLFLLDNNAGAQVPGDFESQDEAAMRRIVEVNLNAALWCTRAFLPGMRARGEGQVVMIASAAGLIGVPGMAVYSASKHAVVGFAESLRLELRRSGAKGIGVTLVCPSFISTGMFAGASPPLLTPWLSPEDAAARIVAAVRSRRAHVRAPWMVRLIPLIKCLPQPLIDVLGELTGMHRAIRGR